MYEIYFGIMEQEFLIKRILNDFNVDARERELF